MSLSFLLLGLATIPGAVAPAGIHSTLRRTCVGNACAGITDPRAFVDKIRGIFSAQRSSTTAAHSFSPAARPARMATALVAEADSWSAWGEDYPPPSLSPASHPPRHSPSLQASAMATHPHRTPHPPSTAPPKRCPRCYGHHSNVAICRGRPVPGVTAGVNQSPSMPPNLDPTHPSAPCAYHSSHRGSARHTNSECARSSSAPPPKRARSFPSQGARGRARSSAMATGVRFSEEETGEQAAVWQPRAPSQAEMSFASDDQGDLEWEGDHYPV
jgi:hypothetical protein